MNRIGRSILPRALLGLVLALPPLCPSVDRITARRIEQEMENHRVEIIRVRRFIHMNPELRDREFQTAKLFASKLISLGLDVQTGIGGTGVVGLLHGDLPGLAVCLRVSMDADPIQEMSDLSYKSLNPGLMHAKGNDIHTSIALGTAAVLKTLKDTIPGSVKFIFQPATFNPLAEDEGGALRMVDAGVLDNPPVNAIFGLQVWPENVGGVLFSPGTIMTGIDRFQITVIGRSAPEGQSYESVDAINLSAQVIVSLQSALGRMGDATDPVLISIDKITGGNGSEGRVEIQGSVKTLSENSRNAIPGRIEDIVKGITHALGGEYGFRYIRGVPPVYNHPQLAQIMLPTLTSLLGSKNVKPLTPLMIGDDFSRYCQNIPGFFFLLGAGNPALKTAPVVGSSNFNPDERSIFVGIKTMCHLLLDCLNFQSRIEDP